jgi:cytochrome c biogenesis protein CcmG/thiol:disulfide interchange protein DsbE
VAIVLAAVIVVFATRPPASTRVTDSPLLGRISPSLAGETIDGQTFDESSLRGRWVVLNFFATWCVPCRLEHDDLIRFASRHDADGDAAVVGVVFDDSVSAVRRFREDEGGSWPMLTDPEGELAVRFGVAGVPESFLISPNGVVMSKIVGGILDGELEKLLTQAKAQFLT